MLSRTLKNGLINESSLHDVKVDQNIEERHNDKNGHTIMSHDNISKSYKGLPWMSRSISSSSSNESASIIGKKIEEGVADSEDDNNLLVFKPRNIYKRDDKQVQKEINREKNEYVPDLNFNNIVKKWELEDYMDQHVQNNDDNDHHKDGAFVSFPQRIINKNNFTSGSNSSSTLALNDKSAHSQVEPIPLPSYKNSWTTPSTLELERRSSYLNLLNPNVNSSNPNRNDIIRSNSGKNSLRQTPNSLVQNQLSFFIPRSRRPSSLRGLSSPKQGIPNILEVDDDHEHYHDNDNDITNNNSDDMTKTSRIAPLTRISTDTTMASIDGNMSSKSSYLLSGSSFPSETSLNQMNYNTAMSHMSTMPIDITKSKNDKLKYDNEMCRQYFNNNNINNNNVNINNNTKLSSNISMDKDELISLIKLLPTDFLNLPYSQRKAKILAVLPKEKLNNYKEIMSLIKKVSLTSSKSNSSLGSFNFDISNSLNNGNEIFNNTNHNNKNKSYSNLGNISGLSINRHNSVASQYLSTFSPLSTSMLNLNNNNNNTGLSSSFKSNFVRPSEKGMQLFNHTLESIIGYGAWGMIRKCVNNSDGSLRAIKIIKFKNNEKIKNSVMREINIWSQLQHENILPLINYQIDNEYAMYCLTELIEDGTLYDLVLSWDNYANSKISHITRCKIVIILSRHIIKALKYLHKDMGIIHGDIKLENCLINKNHKKSTPKNWKVIICDFGMSFKVEDCCVKDKDSHIGSLPYASPELLTDNKLNEKADIWAFGVMIYTMLVGRFPFKHLTESHLRELIKSGEYDKTPLYEVCSNRYEELADIVIGCLTVDINRRWDLETIGDKLDYLYKKK